MKNFIELAEGVLGQPFDRERFLVVGNAYGKRSVFLYTSEEKEPAVVVRLSGNSEAEARCRAEQDGFQSFAVFNVQGIIVPKILGEGEYGGYACFYQEVVRSQQWQGRIPSFGRGPRRADFLRATDYLIQIFQGTRRDGTSEIPVCFEHGDFWMGNLGQRGGDLVLYDLEYARGQGSPLYDLFHFCLYYRVALRNRGLVGMEVAKGSYQRSEEQRGFSATPDDVREVFINSGKYRALVSACITRYCKSCNIPTSVAAKLLKEFVEHRLEGGRGLQGFRDGWEFNAIPTAPTVRT